MIEKGALRSYGSPPYRVALLHGGPGAPGTMGPLAEMLAPHVSVLEPLQSERSIEGLLKELCGVLEAEADLPVILAGSSWGAMFGFMYAASHPEHVHELIMIGSGPLEESYAEEIRPTRVSRLSPGKQERVRRILGLLETIDPDQQESYLWELSDLFNEADAFDPLTLDMGLIEVNGPQHVTVWAEAREMRAGGQLLDMADRIVCKVVAIHGDHDPHPAEGVEEPLRGRLEDFEFVLLENCGHIPWIERHAKDQFLEILVDRIQRALLG